MKSLSEKIKDCIHATSATVSVVISEIGGPRIVSINPDQIYHAASTIKVPILFSVLSLFDKGLLSLDEKITLTDIEKVGGCGTLKLLSAGTEYPVIDLLNLMICISDNTATNMLIERIGIDLVNADMITLGLKKTHLARKLMTGDSSIYSKTTANDLVTLFENFSKQGPLSPQALQLSREILMNQQLNTLVNLSWNLCGECASLIETDNHCKHCGAWTGNTSPIALPFYHKTGEIVGLEHDAGILTIHDKEYAISVLSNGHNDNYEGKTLLSQIGNLIIKDLLRRS